MGKRVCVRPVTDDERQVLETGAQSADAFTRRRCEIVLASAQGEGTPQIAARLGYSGGNVREVIQAFNARGAAALGLERSRPHRSLMAFDAEGAEQLCAMLHLSPRAFGRQATFWTLALAADVAFEQGLTGRRVMSRTIQLTLERLGTTWSRAKQWVTQPDPEYARVWAPRAAGGAPTHPGTGPAGKQGELATPDDADCLGHAAPRKPSAPAGAEGDPRVPQMSVGRPCAATRPDGESCRAFAEPGSRFCARHNPDNPPWKGGAPPGNQNALQLGLYAGPCHAPDDWPDPDTLQLARDLDFTTHLLIGLVTSQIFRVQGRRPGAAEGEPEIWAAIAGLSASDLVKLVNAVGQNFTRIARLLKQRGEEGEIDPFMLNLARNLTEAKDEILAEFTAEWNARHSGGAVKPGEWSGGETWSLEGRPDESG